MKKYVMSYTEFNEQFNNQVKNNSTEEGNISEIKEELGSSPNVQTGTPISPDTPVSIETTEETEENEKDEDEDNITPIL